MELDRDLYGFFHSLNKLVRVVRREQSRHILYTYRIGAAVLVFLRKLYEVFVVMNRAYRVGYRRLNVSALFLGRVYRGLEVAHVVERVEYPYYVYTVGYRFLHEVLYHVVGVMSVAENVLASKEHLQLCVRSGLSYLSQPVPGILVQESQAGVERRPAPDLERMIADFIHQRQRRKHLLGRHSGRDQRLMSVSAYGFCNSNFCH